MAKDRAHDPKRKFDTGAMSKMGAALGFERSKAYTHDTQHKKAGIEGVSKMENKNLGTHERTIKSEHRDGYPADTKNPRGFAPGAGHIRKLQANSATSGIKRDAFNQTDKQRETSAGMDQYLAGMYNNDERTEGNGTPVVKINSNPAKGK